MSRKAVIWTSLAAIVIGAGIVLWAQESKSPPLIVSKETTVIDGPLNADGTIDYVAALNAWLGEGVTPANNAAIPLLTACATPETATFTAPFLDALKIPVPPAGETLHFLGLYARNDTPPMSEADNEAMVTAVKSRPWKAAEFPVAFRWLKESTKPLALIEDACARPKIFMPLASPEKPARVAGSLPPYSQFHLAAEALLTRAMYRAGQGDMAGEFDDLRRVRVLARFCGKDGMFISYLIQLALEDSAMKSFQQIAARGGLTAEQLTLLKHAIDELPPIAEPDEPAARGEHFYVLDDIMRCIRGNAGDIMKNLAKGISGPEEDVDLGDLRSIDWNIVLREINRLWNAPPSTQSTRDGQVAELDENIKRSRANLEPESELYGSDTALIGRKPIEAFLKRRSGESRDTYARRIGHWMGSSAILERRMYVLRARNHADLLMAHLAAAIAEFQLTHGGYPADLKELGQSAPIDPMSGKTLRYRRENGGYVMWSAGTNERDDEGKEDDIVVRAEK